MLKVIYILTLVANLCISVIRINLKIAHLAESSSPQSNQQFVDLQNIKSSYLLASVYVGKDESPRSLVVDTSYSMTWLPSDNSAMITNNPSVDRPSFDCTASETCDRNEIEPDDLSIRSGKGEITGFVAADLFRLAEVESEPVSLQFLEATKTKDYGKLEFDGVLGLGCNTQGYAKFKDYPVDLFNRTIVDQMAEKKIIKNSMFSVNLDNRDGRNQLGALIIGGWHKDIVSKISLINWYPIANKFSLDVEFFGVGKTEIMVNYDGKLYLSKPFSI